MRPRNKMQIRTGAMFILKKEEPTYFLKYRYDKKKKSGSPMF